MYQSERGHAAASVLIIGDNPTKDDLKEGACFKSNSALYLSRELEAIGIHYKDCYFTTALSFSPPQGKAEKVFKTKTEAKGRTDIQLVNGQYVDAKVLADGKRLWGIIERVRPERILCLGTMPLWFLTGNASITKFRGSFFTIDRPWGTIRLIPTHSVPQIMRKKELIRVFRHDINLLPLPDDRWDSPNYNFNLYPDVVYVLECLGMLIDHCDQCPTHISCDLETRGKLISVFGVAWSKTEALVVPFTSIARVNYWTADEEHRIMAAVKTLFGHPNCKLSGQNFNYDNQYLVKLYGINALAEWDSQHMAHMLWTKNLPLRLDFLSSMFCEHYMFWKDDGKEFHKSITRLEDEKTYFEYNGKDCCNTWEIVEVLRPVMESSDFNAPYVFQQQMFERLARTMNRGVRFDVKRQAIMREELGGRIAAYQRWFASIIPQEWFPRPKGKAKYSPWYDSPSKLKKLFYEVFKLEVIRNKSTKRPTTDQNALTVIGKREPVLRLLTARLCEYSSMCQFQNLYLSAKCDTDGRMRSSYDLAGTDTFRLSSRGDVFDTGMNLQNLSKGD